MSLKQQRDLMVLAHRVEDLERQISALAASVSRLEERPKCRGRRKANAPDD